MPMHFMTSFWSENAVRAVCWTLIHSLWIGTVAAGLAGIVVMMTQKSSARVRYGLLCACMAGFALAVGGVGLYEWSMWSGAQGNAFRGGFVPATGLLSGQSPVMGIEDGIVFFINRYSEVIFAAWLAFFLIKSVWFSGGLLYVHRLRTRDVHEVPAEWKARFIALSQTLGIQQPVRILHSGLIKVPVTVGHLHPVVLVPLGMFFQLPPGQVDTIMLHELAHIMRRDYLVNILQAALETLFFFNPGILWLSSLIREEREVCCDDIVLAQSAARTTYLEALLAFQTYSLNGSGRLGLELGGNTLTNRLKRMIYHENKRLGFLEKLALLVGFLIVSAFCYQDKPMLKVPVKPQKTARVVAVRSPDAGSKILPEPFIAAKARVVQKKQVVAQPDTVQRFVSIRFIDNNHDMPNREMIVGDDQGNVYHLKFSNDMLIKLQVNGQDIPDNEFEQHQKVVSNIGQALSDARERKLKAMKSREMEAL